MLSGTKYVKMAVLMGAELVSTLGTLLSLFSSVFEEKRLAQRPLVADK
jgi:hypothetical protein